MTAATLVVASVGTTGCSIALTCQQRESRGYPALETVAQKTLGSQPHQLVRAGACEDTGAPRATVQAIVSQWDTRSDGVRFLKQHGWHYLRGGWFLSADEKYVAGATISTDGATSEVFLTFTRFEQDG